MNMHYVYLITRDDGEKYIGITNNISRRKAAHRLDDRFRDTNFSMEIIFEDENREEVESKETYFIEKYDTFHNGLNRTITGKGSGHSSPFFTTLGKKFSVESREKMKANHWSKTGKYSQVGRKFSDETRAKMSESRKGVKIKNPKIPHEERDAMIEAWRLKLLRFDSDTIAKHVHPSMTHLSSYDKLLDGSLKKKNGGKLELISMYAYHYAEKFSVNTSAIFPCLRNVK